MSKSKLAIIGAGALIGMLVIPVSFANLTAAQGIACRAGKGFDAAPNWSYCNTRFQPSSFKKCQPYTDALGACIKSKEDFPKPQPASADCHELGLCD